MTEDYEYDPERELWRPGRRSFLFMLGAAAGGLLVPAGPEIEHVVIANLTEKTVTGAYQGQPFSVASLLAETYSRDRIFAPFERDLHFFRGKETGDG